MASAVRLVIVDIAGKAKNVDAPLKGCDDEQSTSLAAACGYKSTRQFKRIAEWNANGTEWGASDVRMVLWGKASGIKSSHNAFISEHFHANVFGKCAFVLYREGVAVDMLVDRWRDHVHAHGSKSGTSSKGKPKCAAEGGHIRQERW